MLAAHRDQENLVLSHQVPTKQAPKTPGARYPKTPSKFGKHDENAPGGFGGKGGNVGDGKLLVKGTGAHQTLVTPNEPQTRAVLGNKTTNAKARTGQGKSGGAKDIAKDIEKSQTRQTTVQKPKQKSAGARKLFLTAKQSSSGLTFEGLKKGNLFKGYYQHFYNPVDENGVSRMEKEFNEEMATVLEEAVHRNEMETEELTWNASDIPEKHINKAQDTFKYAERQPKSTHQRYPPTLSSRRAASALGIASGASQPMVSQIPMRKPMVSKIRGIGPNNPTNHSLIPRSASSAGETASRTTIGYTKGRSASSVLHNRGETNLSRPIRTTRTVPIFDSDDLQLTITPARMRQIASEQDLAREEHSQPQFLSIFDEEEDDEMDLPLISVPYHESDDDEEFEMKLDI
ncbi:hypothetical protein PT974_06599 [Cladobotryum mycophilum]|uniref:Uncharacterized protein n=1 Tax=Cladobotryum mycophilum TaxID=491253 RepID=A0ABR0SN85_9HYPO